MTTAALPRRWYFLGIGGAGMNPLAIHLLQSGCEVAGYDRSPSPSCQYLESLGIAIDYQARKVSGLGDGWGVVYSPAVGSDHPVFEQAFDEGLPVLKRAELLGRLSQGKRVIAVAGTHGKTSIGAMLTHLLSSMGLSVTALIGGYSLNLNGHYVAGTSDWWVLEADEFDRSFHQLSPELAVVTSIDADHLDIYSTEANLQDAFQQFVNQIRPGGFLLMHEALKGRIYAPNQVHSIDYGQAQNSSVRYLRLHQIGWCQQFKWYGQRTTLEAVELAVPGQHNLENMVAALALAEEVWNRIDEPIPLLKAWEAVKSYLGVRRRWEVLVDRKDLVIILDYAHHPEEIRAVIATARTILPDWSLEVIFQPHLFSRTQQLAAQFAQALSAADRLYLTHIYPAREEPVAGVTCEIITPFLRQELPCSILNLNQIIEAVAAVDSRPRIVLVLGAGNIDQLAPDLISRFS